MVDLVSRRAEIAGISRAPDGFWMEQVARNLLDVVGSAFVPVVLHDPREVYVPTECRLHGIDVKREADVTCTRFERLPARSENLVSAQIAVHFQTPPIAN